MADLGYIVFGPDDPSYVAIKADDNVFTGTNTFTTPIAASSIADAYLLNTGDTATGAYVFNSASDTTSNFTIKGNTEANAFYLKADTSRVGVRTATPSDAFNVLGTKNSSTVPTEMGICSSDSTAMAAGVGGGIIFRGKYHTNGSDTTSGAIHTCKETATSGEYGFSMAFNTRINGGNNEQVMKLSSGKSVGIGQEPSATARLGVSWTTTTAGTTGTYSNLAYNALTGTGIGAYGVCSANPASASTGTAIAVYGAASANGTQNVSSIIGVRGNAQNLGSGTVATSYGLWAYGGYSNSTGTVGSAYGCYLYPWTASGRITNYYSLYIATPVLGTTRLTNNTGIYIADQKATGSVASNISTIVGVAGTVTVTTTAVHKLFTNDSVVIAGTTNFNGTYTITVTGTSTFTFALAGDFAQETTGTATVSGAITNTPYAINQVGADDLNVFNGPTVFNEGGSSTSDFRVEGDTDANLLFVDASADKTGVGTNAPTIKFSVSEAGGMTPEGGFAVKLTAGEQLYKGEVVYMDIAGVDLKVKKNPIDGDMPLGVVYADAANDAAVWVVTSGIAEVLPTSGVTATRGYVIYSSGTTAGRVDQAATVPAALVHFREIGHFITTGSGNGVLTKAIIHFN